MVRSKVTSLIMLPPPCQGCISFKQLFLAVEHADSRGREDFVAGKNVPVRIELLHVDRHVRNGLRAVQQHARTGACAIVDHLFGGSDGARARWIPG